MGRAPDVDRAPPAADAAAESPLSGAEHRKPFCAERELPYVESGFWASYREILESMHANAEPLRTDSAAEPAQAR